MIPARCPSNHRMPEVAEASVPCGRFFTALDRYRGIAQLVVAVVDGSEVANTVVVTGIEELDTAAERMLAFDADEGRASLFPAGCPRP